MINIAMEHIEVVASITIGSQFLREPKEKDTSFLGRGGLVFNFRKVRKTAKQPEMI